MVLATDDVRYLHKLVVDDDREVVQRLVHGAGDDHVAKETRVIGYLATHEVGELDRRFRCHEPDGLRLFAFWCNGERAAAATVLRGEALRSHRFPLDVELFLRAIAEVR